VRISARQPILKKRRLSEFALRVRPPGCEHTTQCGSGGTAEAIDFSEAPCGNASVGMT
jgi:hypothetical protein